MKNYLKRHFHKDDKLALVFFILSLILFWVVAGFIDNNSELALLIGIATLPIHICTMAITNTEREEK